MAALPGFMQKPDFAYPIMVCLSGCSGGRFFNQPATHYTVVVTAPDTVTGAHSSTNVTLTVQ
jgi:hypothetical protein